MPYDDPDPTDPMTLHGIVVQTSDDQAMREMAECFAEEYARLNFEADRILRIFQTSGYAGPCLAYRALGENTIRNLIDTQMSLRNRPGLSPSSGANSGGTISLPVIEK